MPLLVLPDGTPLPESQVRRGGVPARGGCPAAVGACSTLAAHTPAACPLSRPRRSFWPLTHVVPPGYPTTVLQVIEQYLLDAYAGVGPSLLPPTPELRAKAHLAARILDLYLVPIQVGGW